MPKAKWNSAKSATKKQEESTVSVVEEQPKEAVKVAPKVVEAKDKTVKVYGLADKKIIYGNHTVSIKANVHQEVPLDCLDQLINMRLVTKT